MRGGLLRGAMTATLTAEEALDLLKHVYPLQEPGPKTRFFLEELLGSDGI